MVLWVLGMLTQRVYHPKSPKVEIGDELIKLALKTTRAWGGVLVNEWPSQNTKVRMKDGSTAPLVWLTGGTAFSSPRMGAAIKLQLHLSCFQKNCVRERFSTVEIDDKAEWFFSTE